MATTKLTKGTRYDLASLTFAGWAGPDAATANADESLDCWAYFADGVYLGPDADGVEPLFRVAKRTIKIYGNFLDRLTSEWAGTGTVDEHGGVECAANCGDAVYEAIEDAIDDGETSGEVVVPAADAGTDWDVTYEWSVE